MKEKIKLRDYNIFYFITLLSILVLKSKEAGIITTFFVVGGFLFFLTILFLLVYLRICSCSISASMKIFCFLLASLYNLSELDYSLYLSQ